MYVTRVYTEFYIEMTWIWFFSQRDHADVLKNLIISSTGVVKVSVAYPVSVCYTTARFLMLV